MVFSIHCVIRLEIIMKKQILINYLKGEATPLQSEEIMRWVEKEPANGNYLANLKMLHIVSTMPQERATEHDFEDFMKNIVKGKHFVDKTIRLRRARISFYISAAIGVAAIIMLFINPLSNSKHLKESLKSELLAELKNGNIEVGLDNIPQESLNTFYTEKGSKSNVVLPDGTNVKLNSDTRITFPNRFVGKTREVHLCGEAFFDVVTDSIHPLVVTTSKNLIIKVIGTKFNIKSYPDDNSEEATLYEGRISLISKGNTYNMLPDNQLVIVHNEKPVKVSSPKMKDIKAWTEGRLVFDETPLQEVIKMLERWHGVSFTVIDNTVLNKTITGTFGSESIYQIMHMLNLCASINYQIKDNTVILK